MATQRTEALGVATLGLAGAVAVLTTDTLTATLERGYDYVADTISDLASGPWAGVQDLGLCLFAVGFCANAVWILRIHAPDPRAIAGGVMLLLATVALFAIALYDAYGPQQGYLIHYLFTAAFALCFVGASISLGPVFDELGHRAGTATRVVAALFLTLAIPFYWVPDSWDGLYERGLGLLVVGWLVGVSLLRLRHPDAD